MSELHLEPEPGPAAEAGGGRGPRSAAVGDLLAAQARLKRAGGKRGGSLFKIGLAALLGAMGYFAYTAHAPDPMRLYLGLAIFFCSALPALLWAKRARFGLPLFEAFMLPGINTYAIPLLSGHQSFTVYENSVINTASAGVLFFQVVALITFYQVTTKPKRTKFWTESIISQEASKVLGWGMIVCTVYSFAFEFTTWIPNAILPEVRAACYGIGIIATFVQCRRWGQNDLPYHEKAIFIVQLVLQIIFTWASLFLVQGVSILLLGLLGYVSGSKRLPVVLLLVAAPLIVVLFNGKGTMRVKYWENHAPAPTVADLPAYFTEWFNDGLAIGNQTTGDKPMGVLDRTSLIQMMCLVVKISPDEKPYMMGTTYFQIPGQFVPRILWPGKPPGLISTFTLCIYYGLQSEEETSGTTIGFGMLPEAYANFGFVGLGMLGIFMALVFNKVAGWAADSPIFSYGGLLTIVLMAWTFQTEASLSVWLSSLVQGLECVLGIPFVLKNFL